MGERIRLGTAIGSVVESHTPPYLLYHSNHPPRTLHSVLITTAEAARRLGVSRERVRQMLEIGVLAGFRVEGRPRARYVGLGGEGSENDWVLVSIQEAAQRSGMSTSTIRRWVGTGRLEAFRLEGDRRVYVAMD